MMRQRAQREIFTVNPCGQGFRPLLRDSVFNFILAFLFSVILVAMTGYDEPVAADVNEAIPGGGGRNAAR